MGSKVCKGEEGDFRAIFGLEAPRLRCATKSCLCVREGLGWWASRVISFGPNPSVQLEELYHLFQSMTFVGGNDMTLHFQWLERK
jgi:hypothetical protein